MGDAMKKLRVLLLNPPTAGVSTLPILNLAYIAAVLRNAGHEVKIIDATAPYKPFTPEQIDRAVADFKPDFIGVTLTITYIAQTYTYLKKLRKNRVPIVAGGPHPNSLPEEVLENGVDIVVVGEGEDTVIELADYFLGNRPIESIAGLCYKNKDEKVVRTSQRSLIKNLDSIPFPDFADFPIKNYTGSEDPDSNPLFWSVLTSRGCPFDCIFCSSHNVFGRVARFRSAPNVVDEIKGLVSRFGARKITFQDDEILRSKKRFIELCDIIQDSKLDIKMSIRTRIDSIDEEILLKCKDIGLSRISFGIESWNDDTLKKINKKYTVDTIHKSFKTIEKSDFPRISFTNICGFPWEDASHMKNNLKEIKRIPKSIPYFTVAVTPIPYPKTKLYEIYNKQYGFTNWWLDVEKNSPKKAAAAEPFFKNFAIAFKALYMKDSYWNYSKKMQKEIIAFSWKLFSMFIKRHYSWYKGMVIILLCRLSYVLWKISPILEKRVFRIVESAWISKLKDNIKFVVKE